jgi:hypothetical protein
VDLRHRDTTKWELSGRLTDLIHADYDMGTVWPEVLPESFNPARQMELGRNPGLGVRTLHNKGITGKGVSIAIIDQELLVDHVEYRDNLKHYEELGTGQNYEASMHGPAVASIAVGKTIGVAPGADLYFIRREWKNVDGRTDFTSYAAAVDRVVEINEKLPAGSKIRVLSMSIGWGSSSPGYDAIEKAVKNARDHGIFVISTSLSSTYGLYFHGLGRDPRNDPEIPSSYGPGSWWAQGFYRDGTINAGSESLLLPMDSRCTAGPSGPEDYAFYAQGGWSWCVPYIAGLYSLACQVEPKVTPESFWKLALATGDTVTLLKDGKQYEFGKIVNPVKLIEALQPAK